MAANNYMIPKECKRLAEVDFPIAQVSRHAAREKSIRHGHPSTLHLWWARRPLASSRAVLLALLLPDPCDPLCPPEFKARARELLLRMLGLASGWDSIVETDMDLRKALLKFISDFANWDYAAKSEYLETGRGLVRAAHPDDTPLVVDPFAGGGSIPLEALRLGCDAFASDLNPVACLILKVMLEDIPRHGPELATELRKAGAEIKAQAERELADLYPKDPDGATPIAYLWARTVRCEAPNCGAEIPLMRSMWLCRKPNRKWALRPNVVRDDGVPPSVEFEIFQPQADREVANGTVSRARATCPCCRAVLPPERVRSQLAAQRGGADTEFDEQGNRTGGARMTAVVTLKPGQPGRRYRLPTDADYAAVRMAQKRVAAIIDEWERGGRQGLCPVPDEAISNNEIRRITVLIYGIQNWGHLFTARQKASLITLTKLVEEGYGSPKIQTALALSISRFSDIANSLCQWENNKTQVRHLFTRQAISMVWDFGEGSFFGGQAGDYSTTLGTMVRAIERLTDNSDQGQVLMANASSHPLPDQSARVWFTDPPYYDSVPYAHLADFFLIWLKRAIPDHPLLSGSFNAENGTSPKQDEIVVDRPHHLSTSKKDAASYEFRMGQAFTEGRRILSDDGVGSVVFAHKTTEGWEAMLSGMIEGGLTITSSWPIATESQTRPNAQDTASLATSVHLVCRPRPEDAPVGEWGVVLRELPERVGDWMARLQGEGVRGADLVFACVGPALEIYSRYSRVETVAGDAVPLSEYLERVWEVVGREALAQVLSSAEAQARNGAAGALEEDARLTALFLWTLQSSGSDGARANGDPQDADGDEEDGAAATNVGRREPGYRMLYDVTRRFAQPLGIHLDDWKSRIIEIDKGVVRLMPVSERSEQLFGTVGASALADEIEYNVTASPQLSLFPDAPPPPGSGTRRGRNAAKGGQPGELSTRRDATTLDRVHAAMLFQDSGRSQALRALIKSEQEKGPDFLRLANALSALYPGGSHEKRLLDAMLLAVPR